MSSFEGKRKQSFHKEIKERKNKAVLKKRGWSYVRGSIDGNRKRSFQKKKVTGVHLVEIGSKIFRRKQ